MTMPSERIALTDSVGLLEMVLRIIFGEDQTVDIVTSGLFVRVLKLIGAGCSERFGLRRALVDITPGEAVIIRKRAVRLINNRLIHVDMNVHQGVATDISPVMTGYIVCRTVV